MSLVSYLMMFGWIPAIFIIFNCFSAQWSVIVSFVFSWLFLPEASFQIQGLPDYTKTSATCYGILLATIFYDSPRLLSFQLRWLDLPMLVWCLCPLASSLTNDLGLYDGVSAVLEQTVTWGGPYLLGRIYLNNLAGLRRLAIGIFVGGIIYIPLCLYEIRMSPQLHRIVYGFYAQPTKFSQTIRYGGFRPTVFMQHGLMVGMWMMAAVLVGIWLWKTGVLKQIWGIPMSWLVTALLLTFVMVKSTGAYLYMILGVGILFTAQQFRSAFPLLLTIAVISFYLFIGASGTFNGDSIVSLAAEVFNEDRAGSLETRFINEEMLSEKARQKPIFGWGKWGRARIYNEWGEDISKTDSLWIIAFGNHGAVGLISLTASMLLPVVALLKYPARLWSHPQSAPAIALAVILVMYMLDCTLNAMFNPVFVLASGAIAGLVPKPVKKKSVSVKRIRAVKEFQPRR